MTREEAIEIIKRRSFSCIECIDRSEECCKALDMAIQALEQTDGDLIYRDALLKKMWSDFYKLQEEHEKEQGYEYIGTKRCLEQNGFECALKTVINFPKSEQTDGDLISRKAVITMLQKIENAVEDGDGFQFNEWIEYAKDIPSAENIAGDLISRKAVIQLTREMISAEEYGLMDLIDEVKKLPTIPQTDSAICIPIKLKNAEHPFIKIFNGMTLYYDKSRHLIFTGFITQEFLEKCGAEIVADKTEEIKPQTDSVLEDIKAEILDETVERVIEIDKVISIVNKHISRKE